MAKDIQIKYQQGSTLIVSLLILLIMTLLGLAAMKSSTMENTMATNFHFQTVALNSAEAVARTAELDVDSIVTDATALDLNTVGDQYYLETDIDPTVLDWGDIGAGTEIFDYAGTAENAYVIEYVGTRAIPGNSSATSGGGSGTQIYVFLVTSNSTSGKGARGIVQTVYLTSNAP